MLSRPSGDDERSQLSTTCRGEVLLTGEGDLDILYIVETGADMAKEGEMESFGASC